MKKTPLKKIGKRGMRMREADKNVSEKVRSLGYCELKRLVPNVICIGGLMHHHIEKRGELGSRHDEENGICMCFNHHNWLHSHPQEARKLGLIKDSKSKLLEINPPLV